MSGDPMLWAHSMDRFNNLWLWCLVVTCWRKHIPNLSLNIHANLAKVLGQVSSTLPSSTSKYQVLLNFKVSSTSKYQVLEILHQVQVLYLTPTLIWTNAGLLSIGPLRTYLSENLIKMQQFSLKKMHLKMSPGKWRPSCLGLNVLKILPCPHNLPRDIVVRGLSVTMRFSWGWNDPSQGTGGQLWVQQYLTLTCLKYYDKRK